MITVVRYNDPVPPYTDETIFRPGSTTQFVDEPGTMKHIHRVRQRDGIPEAVVCEMTCSLCGFYGVRYFPLGTNSHTNGNHMCKYYDELAMRSMTHDEREIVCVF